jgi:hypothetical protein
MDTRGPIEHAEGMSFTFPPPAVLSVALVLLAAGTGCHRLTGEPTREITTPEPQTFFVSTPGGVVAQVRYEEPLEGAPDFQLKPLENWSEQETAADALGRIGQPAVPALVEALKSPQADVRVKAAEVLARMGTGAKDAAPQLTVALDDPDERVRKTATRALGMIGQEAAPAVPALMRSLMQPEPAPPSGKLRPVPAN